MPGRETTASIWRSIERCIVHVQAAGLNSGAAMGGAEKMGIMG
jgi:hypothetical protein